MKIVGITSSPKNNGNTATLLRAVLEGAKQEGAEIEEIFLPDYKIKFCQGCFQSEGGCPLDDDFDALKHKISNADGIILGSPNYAFSPNAMMKRMIERLGMFEYMTSSILGGKYLVGLATTAGQGAKKVAKYLVSISQDNVLQRSYTSGLVTASQTTNKPVAKNEKVLAKARNAGNKLASDIKSSKRFPLQNIITRIINKLILKPKFKKIIKSGKDDDMQAVYDNLISRGLISADGQA